MVVRNFYVKERLNKASEEILQGDCIDFAVSVCLQSSQKLLHVHIHVITAQTSASEHSLLSIFL